MGPALSSALLSSNAFEWRDYAALASFCCCSVFTPIAQMKPSSSRPSAVDDLVLVLAARRHRFVAFVQPLLRFPGDLFYLFADGQILLPAQQITRHVGPMLIRPRRLDQHPSEVTVARSW